MQPISFPSRSRKPATEILALVICGFWPLIRRRLSTADFEQRLVLGGPADAHVDDDLLQLGDRHLVGEVELRRQGRGDRLVILVEQAGHSGRPSSRVCWALAGRLRGGAGRLGGADVAQAGRALPAVALFLAGRR